MHKECEQRVLKRGDITNKLGEMFNLTKSQRNTDEDKIAFFGTVLGQCAETGIFIHS